MPQKDATQTQSFYSTICFRTTHIQSPAYCNEQQPFGIRLSFKAHMTRCWCVRWASGCTCMAMCGLSATKQCAAISSVAEGALLGLVVPDLHRSVIGPKVVLPMDCCFRVFSEIATQKWCMASHLQVNTSITQAFWNISAMVKPLPSWYWSSCLFGVN